MESTQERKLQVGDIVKHFKGGRYIVLGMPTDTETEKLMVYYKHMETGKEWVRPYDMFMSKVDHEKYPDVKQEYRFEVTDWWDIEDDEDEETDEQVEQ